MTRNRNHVKVVKKINENINKVNKCGNMNKLKKKQQIFILLDFLAVFFFFNCALWQFLVWFLVIRLTVTIFYTIKYSAMNN